MNKKKARKKKPPVFPAKKQDDITDEKKLGVEVANLIEKRGGVLF